MAYRVKHNPRHATDSLAMPIHDQFVTYFTQVQASDGWNHILESFERFLAVSQDAHVLDVGCGPGALVRKLARQAAFVYGCDADHGMIDQAQQLAQTEHLTNVEYRVGLLPALPYPPDRFDAVTATNVIFLQHDPLAALRGLVRVCKSSGLIAMLNPSPQMSIAAATLYADQHGLIDFNRVSFINWAKVAVQNQRFSEKRIQQMFEAIGLSGSVIEAKIGGLALFAKGTKN